MYISFLMSIDLIQRANKIQINSTYENQINTSKCQLPPGPVWNSFDVQIWVFFANMFGGFVVIGDYKWVCVYIKYIYLFGIDAFFN